MAFGLGTALLAGGLAGGTAQGSQGKKTAAPSSAGFQRVYEAGTRDPDGQFMGGTEMYTLASHAGKLWAATGYYWDLPGKDPSPGAQVLVLDRPGGTWRVDHQFD